MEAAIEVKMSEFKAGSRAKATGLLRPKDIKANIPLVRSIIYVCHLLGLSREFSFAALGELQAMRIIDVISLFPSRFQKLQSIRTYAFTFLKLSLITLVSRIML